jgi:hypothetical protein
MISFDRNRSRSNDARGTHKIIEGENWMLRWLPPI